MMCLFGVSSMCVFVCSAFSEQLVVLEWNILATESVAVYDYLCVSV